MPSPSQAGTGWTDDKGCILIPGYLDPEQQLDLLTSALSEYTLPPNPLSLSTHYDLPPDLFELSTRAPTTPISSLFTSLSEEEQAAIRDKEAQLGHRSAQNPKSGAELRYSQILERGRAWEGDTPGSRLGERTAGELIKELRWANLGWVYRVCLVLVVVWLYADSERIVDDQGIRFRYRRPDPLSSRPRRYVLAHRTEYTVG